MLKLSIVWQAYQRNLRALLIDFSRTGYLTNWIGSEEPQRLQEKLSKTVDAILKITAKWGFKRN